MTAPSLVLCSKSPWQPTIRREHALATQAARHGWAVDFLEAPGDVRAITKHQARAGWIDGLRRREGPASISSAGVAIWPRSALVPGHRGRVAEATENHLLRGVLRHLFHVRDRLPSATVGMVPWQWHAIAAVPGRRVFDCADNMAALFPQRRGRLLELYRRVADEADAIVVVNDSLSELFRGRRVVVVPNGTPDDATDGAPRPRPDRRRLLYVGTLSERVDAPLLDDLMGRLPDWTLDLYGPCRYAGHSDAPSAELRALLDGHHGRVRWHGLLDRRHVSAAVDAADVVLLPNRVDRSMGQSSMKTFDYAARGRPVVSTEYPSAGGVVAPRTASVTTAAQMAEAVREAVSEPAEWAEERTAWAEANAWSTRWRGWARAVVGDDSAELDG